MSTRPGTITVNVRHRPGILGRAIILAARTLALVGVAMPACVITWAINHSSYVSIDGGPWQRFRLDLKPEDL